MTTIEEKIVNAYIPYETTLREVARQCGTNHHTVKRILKKNGMAVVKGRSGSLTREHKDKISKSCKGRQSWAKGKKMDKSTIYKNMAAHLRFDVSYEWLSDFPDIEKLKLLNACITDRSGRFRVSTVWYKKYIGKFYHDDCFNNIYTAWVASGYEKYKKPSIDHTLPRAKGGTNDLDNLQFLTWFENRCKNDMSQESWDLLKHNIGEYFV